MHSAVRTTQRKAFGADIPDHIYLGMGVLIGLPVLGFVAFEMWKTVTENRRIRRERRKLEEIQEVIGLFVCLFVCVYFKCTRFLSAALPNKGKISDAGCDTMCTRE